MTALRAGKAGFDDRETQGPLWIRLDVSVILLTVALVAMGLVVVYSATRGVRTPDDTPNRAVLEAQIIFVGVGAFLGALAAAVDYRKTRAIVPVLYALTVVLLVGLFFFGSTFNNATSWYSVAGMTLQPSELAKLTLIVALASWFSNSRDSGELSMPEVALGGAIAGLLGLLVLMQPDYGTVMVYGAIVAGIVVVGGVKPSHVVVVLFGLVGAVAFLISSERLEAYQIDRFTAFAAETGTRERYNVDQAEIAIGNGGLTGQGLFEGTQNNNSLVPEKETDFIFSVLGEELGFVGGATLLVLFGLLLARIWRIAVLAENDYGRLIAVGVFSMFLFQAFQSVGMNMGIMPVTGIPLPMISAGGTSMITSLIAIGLVENVHAHRLR